MQINKFTFNNLLIIYFLMLLNPKNIKKTKMQHLTDLQVLTDHSLHGQGEEKRLIKRKVGIKRVCGPNS